MVLTSPPSLNHTNYLLSYPSNQSFLFVPPNLSDSKPLLVIRKHARRMVPSESSLEHARRVLSEKIAEHASGMVLSERTASRVVASLTKQLDQLTLTAEGGAEGANL
jgi:hypothetical protein